VLSAEWLSKERSGWCWVWPLWLNDEVGVGVKDVELQQAKQVSNRRQGIGGVTLHVHLP
jgi:hypothetical protein